MSDRREEFQDRLIDLALQEQLGGQQPPDLSQRILAAANSQPTPAKREKKPRRRSLADAVPLGISLCLLAMALLSAMLVRVEPDSMELAYSGARYPMLAELIHSDSDDLGSLLERLSALMPEAEYLDPFSDSTSIEYPDAVPFVTSLIPVIPDDGRDQDTNLTMPGPPVLDEELDRTAAPDFDSLTDLITSSIEPKSWVNVPPSDIEKMANALGYVPAFGGFDARLGAYGMVSDGGVLVVNDSITIAKVTDGTSGTMIMGFNLFGDLYGMAQTDGVVSFNRNDYDAPDYMNMFFEMHDGRSNRTPDDRRDQLANELEQLKALIDNDKAILNSPLQQRSLTPDQREFFGRFITRIESLLLLAAAAKTDADSAAPSIDKNDPNSSGDEKPAPRRTWRRARATPNASRLMIGDRDELIPQGLQANVMIDGFRARVLLDYYYYNDRDRPLEGTFKLRLPDEASLYYFAFGETTYEYRPQSKELASLGFLDTNLVRAAGADPKNILALRSDSWRQVKEARLVTREKASYAYGETTHRRIDPALVEWSGAGVFAARVFPLAPGKLHRIVIGYDVNLEHEGDDLVYRLGLPADVPQSEVDISLASLTDTSVEISPAVKPTVAGDRRYYHFQNPTADEISVIQQDAGATLLSGSDPETGDFFAVEFEPTLPTGEDVDGSSHAMFLLDTSLSAQPQRFNLWLDLTRSILNQNRQTITHFAVLVFNIETRWWNQRYVENTPRNVADFMRYAHTLSLEGATDLGQALRQAASPSWLKPREASKPDLFLLSDGALTWGKTNLRLISKPLTSGSVGSLFAYKTNLAPTATSALEFLAHQTGGSVFSVTGEEEIDKAATAHRGRPWQLLDVTIDGGDDLLLAGRPESLYPGQRLLLVGRGRPTTTAAQVLLRCSRGGQERMVKVDVRRAIQSDLTPRLYGQVAVGQLESLASATEDIATAYARHFRITGQSCSLLMLESEQDYQRFDIKLEDDAFVVKSSPAMELIDRKIDQLDHQLEDAKATLLDWLAKMQNMPGVQFEQSTALRLAIDKMPNSAFDVSLPRLNCQSAVVGDAPRKYTQALLAGAGGEGLDYDVIYAEADRRRTTFGAADALKAISSLVENSPGDTVVLSDVAFSAIQWELAGQAYPLLRRVARARPYQPQVYLALGRCLVELGHADLAMIYYELSVGGNWDGRFGDFRRIAAVEYLGLLRKIAKGELECHALDFAKARRERLTEENQLSSADILVTMMWNTDRTDVDLHIVEPSGEVCNYQHTKTASGGRITRDVTQGFGPEMFTLPNAPHGKYEVKINYFGSDANRLGTRTKVVVTIYQNFGSPDQRTITEAITLGRQKEMRQVATIGVQK